MIICNYNAPDFTKVALAYDIDSFSIYKPEEIELGLTKPWKDPTQPFFLEVSMDINTDEFPKMVFGSPISKMEPEITP
jgi:acetolactate synthase I/II/III large subunit